MAEAAATPENTATGTSGRTRNSRGSGRVSMMDAAQSMEAVSPSPDTVEQAAPSEQQTSEDNTVSAQTPSTPARGRGRGAGRVSMMDAAQAMDDGSPTPDSVEQAAAAEASPSPVRRPSRGPTMAEVMNSEYGGNSTPQMNLTETPEESPAPRASRSPSRTGRTMEQIMQDNYDGVSTPVEPDQESAPSAEQANGATSSPPPRMEGLPDLPIDEATGLPLLPGETHLGSGTEHSPPPGGGPSSSPGTHGEAAGHTASPSPSEEPGASASSTPGAATGTQPPQEPQEPPVDPLHATIMNLMNQPRMAGLENLRDERSLLERRRAELSAQEQAAAAKATMGGGGGGKGGLLSGLGGMLNKSPSSQIKSIDQKLRANITREKMVYGRQYGSAMKAADDFYRSYAALRRDVEAYNSRFDNSEIGKKFLRNLEYCSRKTGLSTDEIRSQMHARNIRNPAIKALAEMADQISSDPQVAAVQEHIAKQSSKLAKDHHAFAESLQMLGRNDVDMSSATGLSDALDKMEVPDAKLAKPGGAKIDKMKEEFKKLVEALQEITNRIVNAVKSALGFGG